MKGCEQIVLIPAFVHRLIGPNEPWVFRSAQNLPWYGRPYVSDAEPIIVGGCGRSGTTLMRVILDTHEAVCCGPETSLLCCWRPRWFFLRKLARSFDLPAWEIRDLIKPTRSHAEFVDRFFDRIRRENGAERWAEKTPRNVHAVPYVFRHFPNARFIHMIRDGRDTVCSLRKHPRFRTVRGQSVPTNINNPLRACIRRWVNDVRTGLQYREDPRYIEVRYEDLVDNADETLRALFRFLDLPWQPDVLHFHQVKSDLRDVSRFPQNPEAVRPMYKSAVGRWQFDLSDNERALFESLSGDLLEQLGYK